ncbi:hypothetical protein [Kitasatospora sp. NPDC048407]|uniref:hypothetical protein n=1 Tax=Kitasatospora sp. NPDC048407 TaxID=3364051 RepID=UPI003721AAAF
MRDADQNSSGRGPTPRQPLVRQGRVGPPARPEQPGRRRVHRGARLMLALGAGAAGIAVMASCGGTSGEDPVQAAMSTFVVGTERFSGEPPSPLGSLHSSALASVSAAQASASQRAAEFEASANAQLAAGREKATAVLSTVQGSGNALGDVTLTGIPTQTTGDVSAAKVTITNSTQETRSYAIQVDFTDPNGQSVDSSVVGVENVVPGATVNPVAFSTKGAGTTLTPVVVKAQRY